MRLVVLWRFTNERFAPWVTVPIAGLLYPASARLWRPGPLEAAAGALATLLGLLCLRIADDLADLGIDRGLHPERGLPSGRIDAAQLRRAGLLLGATLVALESSSLWRLAFFLGGSAFYRVWYAAFRSRVHRVARPFLSNLVFPCAVLHGAGPVGWRAAIGLALFAWLAAVSHEFAHNVDGYAALLGARGTAILSSALFAAAAIAAASIWLDLGRPAPFGVVLAAAAGGLGFLQARLMREPGPRHARALYRAGILFGLAPAVGILLG